MNNNEKCKAIIATGLLVFLLLLFIIKSYSLTENEEKIIYGETHCYLAKPIGCGNFIIKDNDFEFKLQGYKFSDDCKDLMCYYEVFDNNQTLGIFAIKIENVGEMKVIQDEQ